MLKFLHSMLDTVEVLCSLCVLETVGELGDHEIICRYLWGLMFNQYIQDNIDGSNIIEHVGDGRLRAVPMSIDSGLTKRVLENFR